MDRSETVARYKRYLGTRSDLDLRELRGKNLVCWCPLEEPCHADVLLQLANRTRRLA